MGICLKERKGGGGAGDICLSRFGSFAPSKVTVVRCIRIVCYLLTCKHSCYKCISHCSIVRNLMLAVYNLLPTSFFEKQKNKTSEYCTLSVYWSTRMNSRIICGIYRSNFLITKFFVCKQRLKNIRFRM